MIIKRNKQFSDRLEQIRISSGKLERDIIDNP